MSYPEAERFIARLRRLDAGTLSAFQAAAGRDPLKSLRAFDAYTAVLWSVRRLAPSLPREACWLVATLFPLHPKPVNMGRRINLGAALAAAREKNPRERGRLKRHLHTLLQTPFDRLAGPLGDAVRTLARLGVRVDWPQLLDDLGRWRRPPVVGRSTVHESWAKSWVDDGDTDGTP